MSSNISFQRLQLQFSVFNKVKESSGAGEVAKMAASFMLFEAENKARREGGGGHTYNKKQFIVFQCL